MTDSTDNNCDIIKNSAPPATGHPLLVTSKTVTVVFPCPAGHPASTVGQSRRSQHETYCRRNLGDILKLREI